MICHSLGALLCKHSAVGHSHYVQMTEGGLHAGNVTRYQPLLLLPLCGASIKEE